LSSLPSPAPPLPPSEGTTLVKAYTRLTAPKNGEPTLGTYILLTESSNMNVQASIWFTVLKSFR
jgi:hypothetical protein